MADPVVRKFAVSGRAGALWMVTVTDHHRGGQVSISCTCPAFRYSRWRECAHVKTIADREQLFTVIGGCLVNYPPDVAAAKKARDET